MKPWTALTWGSFLFITILILSIKLYLRLSRNNRVCYEFAVKQTRMNTEYTNSCWRVNRREILVEANRILGQMYQFYIRDGVKVQFIHIFTQSHNFSVVFIWSWCKFSVSKNLEAIQYPNINKIYKLVLTLEKYSSGSLIVGGSFLWFH